jgi:hypothetical protein
LEPSWHITTVLLSRGTTTVVFFSGGGGLPLLMQPANRQMLKAKLETTFMRALLSC